MTCQICLFQLLLCCCTGQTWFFVEKMTAGLILKLYVISHMDWINSRYVCNAGAKQKCPTTTSKKRSKPGKLNTPTVWPSPLTLICTDWLSHIGIVSPQNQRPRGSLKSPWHPDGWGSLRPINLSLALPQGMNFRHWALHCEPGLAACLRLPKTDQLLLSIQYSSLVSIYIL